ncbi:hypothetical protein ACQY0O_003860 [Thecaphora frezii]
MKFSAVTLIALVAAAQPYVSAQSHTFNFGRNRGTFTVTRQSDGKVTACGQYWWHWCNKDNPEQSLAFVCHPSQPGDLTPCHTTSKCDNPGPDSTCFFREQEKTHCSTSKNKTMNFNTWKDFLKSLQSTGICFWHLEEDNKGVWLYEAFLDSKIDSSST